MMICDDSAQFSTLHVNAPCYSQTAATDAGALGYYEGDGAILEM